MVAEQGFNNIGLHFLVTYTYVPPGADFNQRYLVVHEGSITAAAAPQHPQVRVALSRWRAADDRTWMTTGPPIFSAYSYKYDAGLGYLMTGTPTAAGGVKLDECFSAARGVGFLAEAGGCLAHSSERRRPGDRPVENVEHR